MSIFVIGVGIGTICQASLMFWGRKTNKVIIKVVGATFISHFVPTLVLDTVAAMAANL